MKIINLLIADDHPMVADSLGLLLESEPSFNIVGVVNNGWQAIQFVQKYGVDIVLADLQMPLLNGLEMAEKLKEQFPKTKVVILTMSEDSQNIKAALTLGIEGYILKSATKTELIQCIKEVSEGKRYFSERIEKILNQIPSEATPSGKLASEEIKSLTRREKEIIRLVAEDMSNAQIAETLHIAPTTVETHRRNLMKKLGVNSAVALIKLGMKYGIITHE
ncbi:response regulator [Leadbetterella byssophila]|uniref:Two component transcriptional regulator, LuxR family n=1 Tax=Leadbetterella byssophila (strain DSM 17132 / JCM 16389 / KACC 11308 / NBRC 106382 / 4M15) TaxID=649349 RepID=E4RUW6_LEAB4|nr:response regulator transcription factor [Leadbetterella byssophila]ADQ16989.1 two component transcriptional regulator, LuxR family [Leadbetterella byssophila DSM 17132]